MTVLISWNTIITAAAILAAAGAITASFAKIVRWLDRQRRQDDELSAIKQEQSLLTCGVLACLKGLREQGCNGPVTEAIERIERHLNLRAHA